MTAFTDVTRHLKPGHRLLEKEENPFNLTEKFVVLTEDGERFKQNIIEIMKGE